MKEPFSAAPTTRHSLLPVGVMLKYASPHGGNYKGVSVNIKKPFLILGTNVTPVTTPTGVKKIEGQNGTWHHLLTDVALAGLDYVDGQILATLSKSSEALFGMSMTTQQLTEGKVLHTFGVQKGGV